MTAVEVCQICDIAGCHHIRERKANEELDAMIAGLDTISCRSGMDAEIIQNARAAITTLRAQLAEARVEIQRLDGGWHTSNREILRASLIAKEAEDRADRAEAALAAQIEADATLTDQQFRSACLSYRHDFGMLDHDAQRAVIFDAREWWRAFRREIRNQPHDRTALNRVVADAAKEAREKALRDAAAICKADFDCKKSLGVGVEPLHDAILALVEKPDAHHPVKCLPES